MTGLIDEHVGSHKLSSEQPITLTTFNNKLSDEDLKSWILPNFTTTTHNDTVICAVYMMSTVKAYVDSSVMLS